MIKYELTEKDEEVCKKLIDHFIYHTLEDFLNYTFDESKDLPRTDRIKLLKETEHILNILHIYYLREYTDFNASSKLESKSLDEMESKIRKSIVLEENIMFFNLKTTTVRYMKMVRIIKAHYIKLLRSLLELKEREKKERLLNDE